MEKYRREALTIESARWIDGSMSKLTSWILEALNKNPSELGSINRIGKLIFINTLGGVMQGNDGDYIIKGVNGDIYPCKPCAYEKISNPEVVDAFKWIEEDDKTEYPSWLNDKMLNNELFLDNERKDLVLRIISGHDLLTVFSGDYITHDDKGVIETFTNEEFVTIYDKIQ